MAGVLDRIYAASPAWVQNLGVGAYGLVWRHRRFGGGFREYVNDFQDRERFTAQEWQAFQIQELRRLLVTAATYVPYYFRQFNQAGLRIEDSENADLDTLKQLPLLEKEAIRSQPKDFIARAVRTGALHAYQTSGTTGTPTAILFTNDMHRRWSAAYEVRVRYWAGVDHRMSRAMIGGRLVVPKANSKPPFWRYNPVERQLYMSAFHISPQNARHYAAALNQYQPDYLVGYASSHYFLARMILEQALKVIQPKAILTSSEKLNPAMRSTLENTYRCPVFDAYSGVEAACLASECEHHRMHVSPDVGIIELLDEKGDPVKKGEAGEIVATGLLNFEQPLIRYRTGDLATWSDEACPCGREMPVLEELVGRLEDTVIGPDGREMVRFHGIFVSLPHIQEGQVIQEELTKFRLKLVVDPSFDEQDRRIINQRFEERLGSIDLTYEYVDKIERTERGKYRAVISHVKRDNSRTSIEDPAD